MKIHFIIAMLFCCFGAAGAKEIDLTLEKAIELALQNDFAYRISQQQVDVYRHRLKNNPLLPQITLDGSKNLDEKLQVIEIPSFTGGAPQRVTLDFTRNYEFTFQVMQPVFTGGKAYLGFRNSLLDLKSAQDRLDNSREETILRVKKSYYTILVMKEYLQAQQEAMSLAETNLVNVQERHQLGLASQYDLLRAELALASQKPELSRSQNMLDISILNLKNILQMSEDTEPRISDRLDLVRFDTSLDEIMATGIENRFEIRQLRFEQEKLANLLKMAYGQYLPQVAIVARYSYRSDFFNFHRGNWEDYYSINLAFSLPIFPGLSRNAQIGELRVNRKILDLNRRMLLSGTKMEIENRYKTLRREFEVVTQARKNLEMALEGQRIAELNYREGLISLLEVNASANDLTQARVALLQAVFNCNIQLAELEKLVGIRYEGGEK